MKKLSFVFAHDHILACKSKSSPTGILIAWFRTGRSVDKGFQVSWIQSLPVEFSMT